MRGSAQPATTSNFLRHPRSGQPDASHLFHRQQPTEVPYPRQNPIRSPSAPRTRHPRPSRRRLHQLRRRPASPRRGGSGNTVGRDIHLGLGAVAVGSYAGTAYYAIRAPRVSDTPAIAVPVKTFDSGDTNRDLHMVQVSRGAQFPVVTVELHLPESRLASPSFRCDLDVDFAGHTAHYPHVPFTQTVQGANHHISGTVPSTLTDFKIDPPSFLTVPIRNEIPVRVDMTWRPS